MVGVAKNTLLSFVSMQVILLSRFGWGVLLKF